MVILTGDASLKNKQRWSKSQYANVYTYSFAFFCFKSFNRTTFTTVGYGLVFPATSATVMNSRACMGISILTTLEAFVGILFSSFWGAIFFSKISRVSSHAQVRLCLFTKFILKILAVFT